MASAPNVASTTTNEPLPNVLQQINFDNPDTLADKKTGLEIAKKIHSEQFAGSLDRNFFAGRAAHWEEVEKWSLGTQTNAEFLPFMNISDANKSLVQMDMTPIMVGAQFVGTLIESMAKNKEYPRVEAVDDDSVDEKANRMFDALYRMHKAAQIDEMQQAAGMQLEPTNVYVPDNELCAKVYFEEEDRLPKEIAMEKALNNKLTEVQYQRSLKRTLLRDNIVFNCEVTDLEVLGNGKYYPVRVDPKSVFYNFFVSDTGRTELSYIGKRYALKVVDARTKFPNLTEQELYNLAKKASQKANLNFPYDWLGTTYNTYTGICPWDDFNIIVIDFQKKVSVCKYYVSKTDSYNKENVTEKKGIPNINSPKSKLLKKDKVVWYRGVYCPDAQDMLYWGLPDVILTDFANTDNSLCTYSINIPNNNGRYVPSLFERALEPLREYALTKLKRKLLIGQLAPSGFDIDIESIRDVKLHGIDLTWQEIYKIKTTTGVQIWSSKGLDPNENKRPPISAGVVDDTINKIMELSNLLISLSNEIRLLLGVPNYRDGADVGDRTAARLAEGQGQASFNVTGFVMNAHQEVMEETLSKMCIFEWQKMVKDKDKPETANDLINTKFRTTVSMVDLEQERVLIEADIARGQQNVDSNGNPLLSSSDAFMIREIQNPKMQRLYLVNKEEENRRKAIEDSQRLQAQNGQIQQDSAKQAQAAQQEMQDSQLAHQKEMLVFQSQIKEKEILLDGVLKIMDTVAKTGMQLPQQIEEMATMVFNNVKIPLQAENKQMVDNVIQQQHEQAAHEFASNPNTEIPNGEQPQMQETPEAEAAETQQEPPSVEQAELPIQ